MPHSVAFSGFSIFSSLRTGWVPMPNGHEVLTERELEILRLVASGASNKQVARKLFISINTVKVHLRNIFAKLEVQSRTEATLWAIREGLVEDMIPPGGGDGVAVIPAPQPIEIKGRLKWLLALAMVSLLLLVALLSQMMVGSAKPYAGSPPLAPEAAISTLSAQSQRWEARAPLPTPRAGLAVVAYRGHIYAIGGEASDGVTGAVEGYDVQTDGWTRLTDKPTPVSDVSAAVIGDKIYVPGGRATSGEVADAMEVYNPEGDAWEEKAPLPVALSAYALAAFEGKLYLFGGWDGSSYLDSVYEYDPERDLWTAKTGMPTARGFAGAAVADGKIYVIGGYDGQEDLAVNEEYDPSKDNGLEEPWTRRAPVPAGRTGAGIAVAANLIHVIGGWEKGAPDSFKYNVRTDSWQSIDTPIEGLWKNLGLALVDTKMYAVGGWNGSYMSANQEYQAIYVIMLPALR